MATRPIQGTMGTPIRDRLGVILMVRMRAKDRDRDRDKAKAKDRDRDRDRDRDKDKDKDKTRTEIRRCGLRLEDSLSPGGVTRNRMISEGASWDVQ
jgi:Ni/Co efflux regulator RcnB